VLGLEPELEVGLGLEPELEVGLEAGLGSELEVVAIVLIKTVNNSLSYKNNNQLL
jgi:hypothetical protein